MESSPGVPLRIAGQYAIYGEIATGGLATVHFGRLLGPAGFSRTVAIKRLHPQFAKDPDFAAMFLDEARMAARIRHSNVLPTLDVVSLDGELLLVMEYIHGESLFQLVRTTVAAKRSVPPSHAVAIIAGALHGLHAAHEAVSEQGEPLGIVHRDVSPQNVLVGVDGVPRVLDFGIAKARGRVHSTREGQLKGKVPYMAPEQLRGDPVDPRTDVYAASVVLWEALTGRRLFKGADDAEIFGRVLSAPVDPPSRHADVPHALDDIVMRGLAREASERFATAHEMGRALESCLPAVASSVIGEWVRDVAATSLKARAEQVKRIEASEPASVAEDDSRRAPVQTPPGDPEAEVVTRLSRTAVPVAATGARRSVRAAAIVTLAAGAIVLLAFVTRRPQPSAPPVADKAVASPTPPDPTTEASALVSAAVTTPAPPPPTTSTPPTTRPARPTRRSTSPTPRPSSSGGLDSLLNTRQ